MREYFTIRCRLDPAAGGLAFLGVAATDAAGQVEDVRPVTPALAALAARLVEDTVVAEALLVGAFGAASAEPVR